MGNTNNRVNNQLLQAELRAGEAFGLTNIVIKVQEQKRDKLEVSVDNYSFESRMMQKVIKQRTCRNNKFFFKQYSCRGYRQRGTS